jgi:hypothetical protein
MAGACRREGATGRDRPVETLAGLADQREPRKAFERELSTIAL